ncbi:uncharacterized protein LOC143299454 isoform X1 [Babylonia areolata]|uniref:uncharacterized protein LOC143299454 isoform X1 n=1 Tax=Babylonia areolata TaxID=304850 RepID=UPI003FCF6AD3
MDYDALTGKGCEDFDPVLEKRKKSLVARSRTRDDPCCGKKCFVVTVVGLFLFVTFVSLPAGVFLIIHGNRKSLVGFKVGGALVVSIPIVIAFAFCLILCFRRKWTRRLTLQPSTRSPTLV